jgi:hypothetical protein
MNTNIEPQSAEQIAVRTGNWLLVVGPRAICPTLLALTARLAEAGPVRVVDGGNRFNVYTVARAARGRSEVLNRITVSRAFTCYQVLTMLEHASATLVAETADGGLVPPRLARAIPVPFIVLDLLSTFYDESVQAGERKRLLRACITHLERLVGVSAPRPTGIPWGDDVHFVDDMLRDVVETAAPRGYPAGMICSANGGWPHRGATRKPPRLVVSVHPPAVPSQTAVELLGQLQASAEDTFFIQPAAAAPEPMRLF